MRSDGKKAAMRPRWLISLSLVALAGCGVDARVRTHTVAVNGEPIELAVSEQMSQDGRRVFLIHTRNQPLPDDTAPEAWSASRRAAAEAEANQRCPSGWDSDGHTESFSESLDWIRCKGT
jgi:hypothetical protein